MSRDDKCHQMKTVAQLQFKGGSLVLSLAKLVLEMTKDHVPTLVYQTYEGIFGYLSHIGTLLGIDRLFVSKTYIINKRFNGPKLNSF